MKNVMWAGFRDELEKIATGFHPVVETATRLVSPHSVGGVGRKMVESTDDVIKRVLRGRAAGAPAAAEVAARRTADAGVIGRLVAGRQV